MPRLAAALEKWRRTRIEAFDDDRLPGSSMHIADTHTGFVTAGRDSNNRPRLKFPDGLPQSVVVVNHRHPGFLRRGIQRADPQVLETDFQIVASMQLQREHAAQPDLMAAMGFIIKYARAIETRDRTTVDLRFNPRAAGDDAEMIPGSPIAWLENRRIFRPRC